MNQNQIHEDYVWPSPNALRSPAPHRARAMHWPVIAEQQAHRATALVAECVMALNYAVQFRVLQQVSDNQRERA